MRTLPPLGVRFRADAGGEIAHWRWSRSWTATASVPPPRAGVANQQFELVAAACAVQGDSVDANHSVTRSVTSGSRWGSAEAFAW